MRFIADLHLHSKYSRATSPKMNARELSTAAKEKGLNLLGSGDFTHPKHLADLKRDLKPNGEPANQAHDYCCNRRRSGDCAGKPANRSGDCAGEGFYEFNGCNFVLSTEVSNIYTQGGKGRRVHNIILAPSFDIVDQINDGLLKWGRLDYDGRPIFGRSCIELADLVFGISKECMLIPSHCWTPWFGIFGSMSGFDSVKECFESHTKNIYALETGMSSSPDMNWRLSQIDDFALVSFSDSHSPYSWRLGREACVFDLDKPSYFEMVDAIKKKDKKRFVSTIETFPEYGKYHFDGHRACNVSFSPEEAKKLNNICPVCGKQLTIGVEHRVEELADRPAGFIPKHAIPFAKMVPLAELLAALHKTTPESKTVFTRINSAIGLLGSELDILLNVPQEKIAKELDEEVADLIMKNRAGNLKVKPGYDGVYGELVLDEKEIAEKGGAAEKTEKPVIKITKSQRTLGEF